MNRRPWLRTRSLLSPFTGGLDHRTVESELRAAEVDVDACVRAERGAITITSGGSAKDVGTLGWSRIGDDEMRCILGVLRARRFPLSEKSTRVGVVISVEAP